MNRRALFATVLLVATPVVCSFAADESAPRPQELNAPTGTADTPAPTETRAATDNLQAARGPDESPFNEIKILPSF